MRIRYTKEKMPSENKMVKVKHIRFSRKTSPRIFHCWEPYLETWRKFDETPNDPIDTYPLYQRYFHRTKDADRSRDATRNKLKMYRDIRDNGFNYRSGSIIRIHFHRDGKTWCNDGHHRISMLKHLHTDAVIEVRDTAL